MGDPAITAIITSDAKTIPTMINRLFILKLMKSKIKTNCMKWDEFGRSLNKKNGVFRS